MNPFIAALPRKAFSLVEVILAIGILSLAILALVGLFAPTLDAIRDVTDSDESNSIVSHVNALLQSSYDDPGTDNREALTFAQVQDAVTGNGGDKVYYYWIRRTVENDGFGTPEPRFVAAQDFAGEFNINELEGGLYAVVFQRVEVPAGQPDPYADLANKAIIPATVSVLNVDPLAAEANPTTLVQFDGEDIDYEASVFDQTALLVQYSTAKLRMN